MIQAAIRVEAHSVDRTVKRLPMWRTAIADLLFCTLLWKRLQNSVRLTTIFPHRCPTKVPTSSSRQFFWAILPTTFRRHLPFPRPSYRCRHRTSLSYLRQNRHRSSSRYRRPSIRRFQFGFVLPVSYNLLPKTTSSSPTFTTRLPSTGGRGRLQLQIREDTPVHFRRLMIVEHVAQVEFHSAAGAIEYVAHDPTTSLKRPKSSSRANPLDPVPVNAQE